MLEITTMPLHTDNNNNEKIGFDLELTQEDIIEPASTITLDIPPPSPQKSKNAGFDLELTQEGMIEPTSVLTLDIPSSPEKTRKAGVRSTRDKSSSPSRRSRGRELERASKNKEFKRIGGDGSGDATNDVSHSGGQGRRKSPSRRTRTSTGRSSTKTGQSDSPTNRRRRHSSSPTHSSRQPARGGRRRRSAGRSESPNKHNKRHASRSASNSGRQRRGTSPSRRRRSDNSSHNRSRELSSSRHGSRHQRECQGKRRSRSQQHQQQNRQNNTSPHGLSVSLHTRSIPMSTPTTPREISLDAMLSLASKRHRSTHGSVTSRGGSRRKQRGQPRGSQSCVPNLPSLVDLDKINLKELNASFATAPPTTKTNFLRGRSGSPVSRNKYDLKTRRSTPSSRTSRTASISDSSSHSGRRKTATSTVPPPSLTVLISPRTPKRLSSSSSKPGNDGATPSNLSTSNHNTGEPQMFGKKQRRHSLTAIKSKITGLLSPSMRRKGSETTGTTSKAVIAENDISVNSFHASSCHSTRSSTRKPTRRSSCTPTSNSTKPTNNAKEVERNSKDVVAATGQLVCRMSDLMKTMDERLKRCEEAIGIK